MEAEESVGYFFKRANNILEETKEGENQGKSAIEKSKEDKRRISHYLRWFYRKVICIVPCKGHTVWNSQIIL